MDDDDDDDVDPIVALASMVAAIFRCQCCLAATEFGCGSCVTRELLPCRAFGDRPVDTDIPPVCTCQLPAARSWPLCHRRPIDLVRIRRRRCSQ
jgi:hypothetical protein